MSNAAHQRHRVKDAVEPDDAVGGRDINPLLGNARRHKDIVLAVTGDRESVCVGGPTVRARDSPGAR
jgi:hypothetical protein